MKHFFVSLFLFAPFLTLFAQEFEDFYLTFRVEEVNVVNGQKVVRAYTNFGNATMIENSEGELIGAYERDVFDTPTVLGNAIYKGKSEEGWQLFDITLTDSPLAEKALTHRKGLLKVKMKSASGAKGSVLYEIDRLGISFFDLYEEKLLIFDVPEYNKEHSADESIIPSLLDDIVTVAQLMREQMDSPPINSGYFKGKDLFTAMENSSYWDVLGFLNYITYKPYKYQGTIWKLGEVYATWIDGGAPGYVGIEEDKLKAIIEEKMSRSWKEEPAYFKLNFLRGVDYKLLKRICSDYRQKVDNALAEKETGKANGYINRAIKIAEFMDDQQEIGWCKFKDGQLSMAEELPEWAIKNFEAAESIFTTANPRALAIVSNELGNAYNALGTPDGFKKGLKSTHKALVVAENADHNSKLTLSITASIYRNQGTSYLGLEKHEKALEAFQKGLTYTNAKSLRLLLEKAKLEFKMAEVYEAIGKSSLKKEYNIKGANTFKEYEKERNKISKL